MTYDEASREVVAEAMTDILPDANFVEELATKHKAIFTKLLEKLKEFVSELKTYFNSLLNNRSREANALKEQVGESVKYIENIVKLFDKVAVEAVENYQATVATEETIVSETETVDEVANNPNGLTDGEKIALMVYKSGGSYTLNAKLRGNVILDEHEQYIVDNLVSALEKLPVYKGKVYRNIQFDGFGDGAARDSYVAMHSIGELIPYQGFISSSTAIDGYPLEGSFVVNHVIESVNGRDLKGYGNNFESEVLFHPYTYYITDRIEYDSDGTPTIYLTEVAYEQQETKLQTAHGGGTQRNVPRYNSRESRQRKASDIPETDTVQQMPEQDAGNSEMQSAVSERDTSRDTQQGKLQGVQAEVSQEVNTNGEETGTVLPHRSDGERNTRLLAESQAEDVSGDGAERNAVDNSRKRGDEAGRPDNRADAERAGRRPSKRNSKSADIRRDDGLTTEVQKDIADQEKLIAEPFANQAELDQKRTRYNEVMEMLNPKEEQSLDSVDEDKVQEQSRAYLNSNKENTNEREETRDNFYRRSDAEIRTVRERGQTAYGYRAVLPKHISRNSKAFASEVKKYGIQAVVHDGLELDHSQ